MATRLHCDNCDKVIGSTIWEQRELFEISIEHLAQGACRTESKASYTVCGAACLHKLVLGRYPT